MRHLNPVAIATVLAAATGIPHLCIETPPGCDAQALAGVLPSDALDQASRCGSAVVAFDGRTDAVLAYAGAERLMSLLPGGTVTLAHADGTKSVRHHAIDNVVVHDFTGTPVMLPLAA